MEDYQKWTRRELKEKRKVEYRFFPNRTPGQTYFVSVLMGFSVMGLAYMILEISKKLQEKKANKLKFQRNLSKTYIPMESKAILYRMLDRTSMMEQRELLDLPKRPSTMISDPEINYPEPKGQMTL